MKSLTELDFIKIARERHNNRYDYSKVRYTNATTHVLIGCPIHGIFPQRPNYHLQGRGCPKCAKKQTAALKIQKAKEQFVARAMSVHGQKYKYDKVEYLNAHTSILIGCSEHGDFPQSPTSHLNGAGCPKCGKQDMAASKIQKNKARFVSRAMSVHGHKYNYDKVVYMGGRSLVIITCPEHGDVWQDPTDHLQGKGCYECGRLKMGASRHINAKNSFLERAQSQHGKQYIYDKTVYQGALIPVIITCPQHGDFSQTPDNHVHGKGCPICGDNKQATTNMQKHKATFVTRARLVHGNKYSYDKTEYFGCRLAVIITCPKHGDFKQIATSHLSGNGEVFSKVVF